MDADPSRGQSHLLRQPSGYVASSEKDSPDFSLWFSFNLQRRDCSSLLKVCACIDLWEDGERRQGISLVS